VTVSASVWSFSKFGELQATSWIFATNSKNKCGRGRWHAGRAWLTALQTRLSTLTRSQEAGSNYGMHKRDMNFCATVLKCMRGFVFRFQAWSSTASEAGVTLACTAPGALFTVCFLPRFVRRASTRDAEHDIFAHSLQDARWEG